MAELIDIVDGADKKINSKLECSICMDSYKQPKLLPCYHMFCKSPCLERLVVRDRQGQSLTCPICRYLVRLTDNGVDGLQTDFHIDHLFEIREFIKTETESQEKSCGKCKQFPAIGFCCDCGKLVCQQCTEQHQTWVEYASHTIVDLKEVLADSTKLVALKKRLPRCKKHLKKKLKIFCNTCSELICSNCTYGFHKDHSYDLVEDVFSTHKEEIVSSLQPIKESLNTVNQSLEAFDARAREINNRRAKTEADINREIDQLHQILDQRRVDLIGSLDVLNKQILESLAIERDKVQMLQVKIESCLNYIETGFETGMEGEVLIMKTPLLQRVEQIMTEFDPDTIQPRTDADIELVTDGLDNIRQTCQEFGEVVNLGSVNSKKSYPTESSLEACKTTTENLTRVKVQTVTRGNKKCEDRVNLIVHLVHMGSRCAMEGEVTQENGRHLITYQPARRGRHTLNIRINSERIQGSPFPIDVTPSLQSLREPVRVIDGLSRPRGTTINSKGQIIVAVDTKSYISVWTCRGEKICTFGSEGSGQGHFLWPYAVAVDRDDNVYVADGGNYCIQKFTSEWKFIATAGSKGNGNLQFNIPIGICFNQTDDNLYICDQFNHRIQVLSTDLTFVRCFGSEGSENGQFQNPVCAAFDDANNLYVTDRYNDRVQVLTTEGNFLRVFKNKASGEQLEKPCAIAIDSSNTVYVSEVDRHCVSVFTAQGDYITSFGSKGKDEGRFSDIWGLSVDQDDSIIVSDSFNGRLQLY